MKKLGFVSLALVNLFLGICLMSFVSAQAFIDLRQGSEQVIEWIVDFAEPFLQILLGGYDYTGLLLFERFLVFLLILSVVYLALKNIEIFESTPAILWIVSVIVPLMAVRFINFEWLNTILVSYQVLGIAIAGILPFIIYMFFLHSITESSTARKIGWIFFIILYYGLWATNETENYAQIYFWTMLASLVFLLLDGTIHRYFEKQEWKDAQKSAVIENLVSLDKKISDLHDASGIESKQKKRELKKLLERRKDLEKRLH